MTPPKSSAETSLAGWEVFGPHLPGAVFRLNDQLRPVAVSESVAALTGWTGRDWLGDEACAERAIHPDDQKRFVAHRRSVRQRRAAASLRFRLLHARTGQVICLRECCVPRFDNGGALSGFDAIWLDDSRAALLEQQLTAAAWSEALAAMATGLAHDFNNILTGVISVTGHFLTQLAPDHAFHEGLRLLHDNSLDASRWIQRFAQLQQARPGPATWHDLNELVADTAQLIRHTLSRRYELTVQAAPEPLPVRVEAVGFQRSLLLLVFRAVRLTMHPVPLQLRVSHEPPGPDGKASAATVAVEVTSDQPTPGDARDGEAALMAVQQFARAAGATLEIDVALPSGFATRIHLPGAHPVEATNVGEGESKPVRWLLMGGGMPALRDEWGAWMRARSFLTTLSGDDPSPILASGDYSIDAAILLLGKEVNESRRWLVALRAVRPELPVITALTEEVGTEIEAEFAQITRLVPTGDSQRDRVLSKLAGVTGGG